MNKGLGIGLLLVGCVGLVGVGVLIDLVGGITARTNIAPDTVALTVFDPLLPGASVRPSWNVAKDSFNKDVEVVLVTQAKDYSLAHTPFTLGSSHVQVPCDIASDKARFELVGQQNRDVLSSVGVKILSPGPDCVR